MLAEVVEFVREQNGCVVVGDINLDPSLATTKRASNTANAQENLFIFTSIVEEIDLVLINPRTNIVNCKSDQSTPGHPDSLSVDINHPTPNFDKQEFNQIFRKRVREQ